MKIFVAVGRGEPFVRTSLEEVQNHLQEQYSTYSNSRPLTFEQVGDHWVGYDWTAEDADGRAAEISDKIYEAELPMQYLVDAPVGNFAVHLEMRVTTRTKKTSYEEVETDAVWGNKDLRPSIIDLFAKKASHVLALSTTEE